MEKPRQIPLLLLSFFALIFLSNPQTQAVRSDLTPQPPSDQSQAQIQSPMEPPVKGHQELSGLGLFPLKQVALKSRQTIYLVPGGHSIGVLLRSKGVMIVGFSPVILSPEEAVYPAKEAGVKVGDLLLAINGQPVLSDDQVRQLIAQCSSQGEAITFKLRRNRKEFEIRVQPRYCTETRSNRMGLFVRDNAGGVGTLTFYHPETGNYGALGHVIANGQSNDPIGIQQGKILIARVEEIHPGNAGIPGEKIGAFIENTDFGDVAKNSTCGIYGKLTSPLENPQYPMPLAAAYSHQISVGPAKILTVVSGEAIQEFDINIQRLLPGRADGKNMIIEITDKALLAKTGGIVQGMSGSPIIQNHRIIGAVTHVFVNDPTRGYGVFIENMLTESGILPAAKETLGQMPQGSFVVRWV